MMVNPTRDRILKRGYSRYITVGENIYRTREDLRDTLETAHLPKGVRHGCTRHQFLVPNPL